MITISNFGWRLGNQLFQIAAAYSFAKRNGLEFLCPKWDYQKFFKLKHKEYNGEPIEKYYSEYGFHFTSIVTQDNTAISGYFQSHKYFDREEMRKVFELENVPILETCDFVFGSCAVHVRRGDYLKYPDHHPLCTLKYYKEAMKLSPVKDFVVFSDDQDWCKENFTGKDFKDYRFFYPTSLNSDITDFYLMSKCDHNIIANSTFSWWAAMLNNSKGQVVISPSKDNWHGVAYSQWNHDDLLPEEWIQIKF